MYAMGIQTEEEEEEEKQAECEMPAKCGAVESADERASQSGGR